MSITYLCEKYDIDNAINQFSYIQNISNINSNISALSNANELPYHILTKQTQRLQHLIP